MSQYGGFTSRRKRNIDLSSVKEKFNQGQISTYGINDNAWANQKKENTGADYNTIDIEEDEEEIINDSFEDNESKGQEELPDPKKNYTPSLSIDGREINIAKLNKKAKFDETHVRFTSYLEKNLYSVIQLLKKQGHIDSITELVNESIKFYLTSNHE